MAGFDFKIKIKMLHVSEHIVVIFPANLSIVRSKKALWDYEWLCKWSRRVVEVACRVAVLENYFSNNSCMNYHR